MPHNPVEQVSWRDCQALAQKLSAILKNTVRLPTEAEWEYACRAGTATECHYGDSAATLGTHAWFRSSSGLATHEVGKTPPNAWGLYDMLGNVREWCEDWFGPYEKGPQKDPQGPAFGPGYLLRGGCWGNYAGACRSAARAWNVADHRNDGIGVRLVIVHGP